LNGRPIETRHYGIAVRVVDTEAELGEILTEMMPAIHEAAQAETLPLPPSGNAKERLAKLETMTTAFAQLSREYHDVIVALRDLLATRGWGGAPARSIGSRGMLQDWEPRKTKDGDLVRITFDARDVTPALLSDLWDATGYDCQASFVFRQRQLGLGETPPATDLDRIMELHELGEHKLNQDWACPACLGEAAFRRLRKEPEEGIPPEDEPASPEQDE